MRKAIKFGVSALLASAVALGSTVPAAADGYRGGYGHGGYEHGWGGYHGDYHRDSGLGDVLLGAAVIGGVAAIASAASEPRYDSYPAPAYPAPVYQAPGYYAPGYPAYGYAVPAQGYAPPRPDPVDQCARAAEQDADQDGGVARVVNIDRVRPAGDSLRVFGTLQIDRGYDAYRPAARPDHTRFDCTVSFGQITRLRLG